MGVSGAQSPRALAASSLSCRRWEAAWSSFDSSRRREDSWTRKRMRMGELASPPLPPQELRLPQPYLLLPLCKPLRCSPVQEVIKLFL